jgi:hypothetical protein
MQWGYCWNSYPCGQEYQVGDKIVWRPSRDRQVRGWTLFGGNECNIGSPEVSDLVVTDADFHPKACLSCGQVLGGAAVEIRDGVVHRVWALRPGELPGGEGIDIFLPQADGSLLPVPEWNDRTFDHFEKIPSPWEWIKGWFNF